MVDQENQDYVIERLCEVWSELDGERAFIKSRPDAEGVQGGCDAIVWRNGREHALEHTLVHTTPQRPFHLDRLREFSEGIVATLHARFPNDFFQVNIPMSEVSELRTPEPVAAAIIEEACRILPTLLDGTGYRSDNAPGVPFTMLVFLGVRGGGEGKVFVGPYGPDDELAKADMRRAMVSKHAKLARYRAEGLQTVLLLDVPETFAFHGYFWEMFLTLAEQVPHDAFDDVVLAGSVGRPPFFHLLKRGGALVRIGSEYADFIEAQGRILYPESNAP